VQDRSRDRFRLECDRAAHVFRMHYREAFTLEHLARQTGMAPSAFQEHFRAVTTMIPLQYRNAMRLQEARRILVADGVDAASAGFEVGFQNPSQFSRNYTRALGASSLRDAAISLN
jgi:AraC-like DNA-binding protein